MTEQATSRPHGGLSLRLSWADALLGAVAVITVATFWYSLDWPLQHDGPLLHYVAWAMDRFGAVPYRDLFETSMPGTFAYHWLIGRLFGWGDAGFKVVDVALILLLGGVTHRLLRPFGQKPALGAVMMFTLSYLWLGPDMTLQRDYVGMVLVVCATALATPGTRPATRRRLALVGLLFGLAALIKPHLTIGLAPLAWYLLWQRRQGENPPTWVSAALATLPVIAASSAVPVLLAVAVLAWSGALPAFLDLVFGYLPLHLGLTGEHQPIDGRERAAHLIMNTLHMRGLFIGVPAAIAGFFVAFEASEPGSERRARLYLLTALAGVYLLYPSFAGQFFFYHWAPFQFFLVALAAMVLGQPTPAGREAKRWGTGFLAAAIALTLYRPNMIMVEQIIGDGLPPPKEGAVDRMETALRRHLQPGDKVQPLDWTGGAVHAMLRVEARLATRFLYDYHFYHHVDRPHFGVLRARFMGELQQAAPRLVLDVKVKPRVTGPNTTDRFPDLEAYLKANYRVIEQDMAFRLLERK